MPALTEFEIAPEEGAAGKKAPRPTDPEPRVASSPGQKRALGICAAAAACTLVWLSLPVASGLFLGTFLAFSLLGAHDTLTRRFHRPGLSAIALALSSGLSSIGGVLLLLYFVIQRAISAARDLTHGFGPHGTLQGSLERLQRATEKVPFGPYDIEGRVRQTAEQAIAKLTSTIALVAGTTFSAALMLFFTVMTTFFVLRNWTAILDRAERMLPLNPVHTRVVLAEFQKVGKEVFVGTMLTGLGQGLLAGVGYFIGGAPEALLLAALTALCSLVPAVGTLLVWVPLGVGLIIAGRVGAGVFELIWGTLIIVVVSDYVIRPRLVGRGEHVPTLMTFIALFGGVEVFGVIGIILGPVVAAVALAVLRTYDREMCSTAAEP
jgi:predicted PurR-regulated permease PerM